jgi:hypothetical protein
MASFIFNSGMKYVNDVLFAVPVSKMPRFEDFRGSASELLALSEICSFCVEPVELNYFIDIEAEFYRLDASDLVWEDLTWEGLLDGVLVYSPVYDVPIVFCAVGHYQWVVNGTLTLVWNWDGLFSIPYGCKTWIGV